MVNAPNSLMFWYPRIKKLNIRQPKTEVVKLVKDDRFLNHMELFEIANGNLEGLDPYWNEVLKKARKIGFPLFMRTDEFSGKHSWERTCFVESEDDLKSHILNLFEETFLHEVPGLRAIVFREYIQMNNLFTAFRGKMPVNPEIRCFIWNGEVVCAHWYWIKDAIRQGTRKEDLPGNWESIIDHQIKILGDPMKKVLIHAIKVAKNFNHYWSVDFCQAANGDWVLIDMAKGEESWHPECEIDKKIRRKIIDIREGNTKSMELE